MIFDGNVKSPDETKALDLSLNTIVNLVFGGGGYKGKSSSANIQVVPSHENKLDLLNRRNRKGNRNQGNREVRHVGVHPYA
jgi:hypothetical protein